MSKFSQGQLVSLKSDRTITGAVVAVTEGYPETRYQVFTATGLQSYYESQLIGQDRRSWRRLMRSDFMRGLQPR